MKTLEQFTRKWNLTRWVGPLGLAFVWVVLASGKQPPAAKTSGQDKVPRPFLEVFRDNQTPPVVTREVVIQSAVGPVHGLLARPETKERLPAVLIIPGKPGLTEWMRQNTRDLSSIGYVVLALDLGDRSLGDRSLRPNPGRPKQLQSFAKTPAPQAPLPDLERGVGGCGSRVEVLSDEQTLARLSAAVRWLRRRADALPDRMGIVGWSWGGEQALALAASTPLQACVICDGDVTDDPGIIAGLRGTAVLGIFGGNERIAQKGLPAFQRALSDSQIVNRIKVYEGVKAGFMGPPAQEPYAHEAADKAFVEIYEFLGKYVEDAPENNLKVQASAGSLAAENSRLSIADIMLAVNAPEGVRGTLMKSMEKEPANQAQWDRVRANAALVAEAGNLLRSRRPPKGKLPDWMEQTKAYTSAAEIIIGSAERRDYTGARRGLKDLASRCASCHEKHR
jgi:dienelactone hydrolase